MKRILFLFGVFSLLLTQEVKAQNVPMVPCVYCGGTGMSIVGSAWPCTFCEGSGRIPDAYEYGKMLALSSNLLFKGEAALARGDYDGAYAAFREGLDYGNAKIIAYVGCCLELGMGVAVDRDLALECYQLACDKGDTDGKAALERIRTEGFWEATDASRKRFSELLAMQINIRNEVTRMQLMNSTYGNTMTGQSQGKRYKEQYDRWERNARNVYDGLTQSGYRVKEDGEYVEGGTSGSWNSVNYTMMMRNLRESQREMRDLRSKAQRSGYIIPQSNYENINVNP